MSYNGKPVTLSPPTVVDNAYIANANEMMAMAADMEHEMFGKEYVLEDGRVTEVHTAHKKVIGGGSMAVTTEKVMEMAEKLSSLAEGFYSLADKLEEADFALKAWYSKAGDDFMMARNRVEACLRYCPKPRLEESDEAV